MAPQLGDRLFAGAQPEHAPAVLLLEVLLDEPADRVVVLDEQKDAPGRPCRHRLARQPALDLDLLGRHIRLADDEHAHRRPQLGGVR